jgi:hypothetical protein
LAAMQRPTKLTSSSVHAKTTSMSTARMLIARRYGDRRTVEQGGWNQKPALRAVFRQRRSVSLASARLLATRPTGHVRALRRARCAAGT